MIRELKCISCKHFIAPNDGLCIPRCKAFPKQIPDEIWVEKKTHNMPYLNDNGIMFEPKETE